MEGAKHVDIIVNLLENSPMIHFHICPTEIAAAMLILDTVQVYAFHYWHITRSCFTKMYHKGCAVCNKEHRNNSN